MGKVYDKIAQHFATHQYKKGKNLGSAPVYSSREATMRIVKYSDSFALRIYQTDCVYFYPDGSMTIDCDGYAPRPITQKHLNNALHQFGVHSVHLCHYKVQSYSQPIWQIAENGHYRKYRYYDGMRTNEAGQITSGLQGFEAKRINKQQTAAFAQLVIDSGFKAMFKVLYEVSEPLPAMPWGGKLSHAQMSARNAELNWRSKVAREIEAVLTDVDRAEEWPIAVAQDTWEQRWTTGGSKMFKRDAASVWTSLMTAAKKGMYEVVQTDITVL